MALSKQIKNFGKNHNFFAFKRKESHDIKKKTLVNLFTSPTSLSPIKAWLFPIFRMACNGKNWISLVTNSFELNISHIHKPLKLWIFLIFVIFVLFYCFSEVATCQGELIKHPIVDQLHNTQLPSQKADSIRIQEKSIMVLETYWSSLTNFKEIPDTEEGKTSFFFLLNPEILAWNLGMCDLSELSNSHYKLFSENMRDIIYSFMGELRNLNFLDIRPFNDFYHYRVSDNHDIFTLCKQITDLPDYERTKCLQIYLRFAPKIAKELLHFLENL